MQSFITSVINSILNKTENLINYQIILPSKRAGVFFKHELKKQLKTESFLPNILSIEEFINDVSEIELLSTTEILFEFYKIYLDNTSKNKTVNFEQFIKWATILIQDINEIDRHLINADYFFNYLSDIKRIENWFTEKNKETNLTNNYIDFFNSFHIYYKEFYSYLIKNNKGYQGLQYREASKNIDDYLKNNSNKNFIIVGFNALNKAEEYIFEKILGNKGEIYFDIDQFFIDNKLPYAKFINKYKTNWNYYNTNNFETITNNFKKEKQINIIGVPKNVTLIKETGEILKFLTSKKQSLQNTALVLANENLLTTALNSLPKEVSSLNITMGYPLKNIDLSNLFLSLIKLHINKIKLGQNKLFYYKDLINVLGQKGLSNYLKNINLTEKITDYISSNNYNFINESKINQIGNQYQELKLINKLLFSNWKNASIAIEKCLSLIKLLNKTTSNNLEIEYLFRFYSLFQQLKKLNVEYGYIKDLETLLSVFKQLLSTEVLSFKGEPLSGLQVMGMLETRVLDFETVIVTSVNEGFIPSGKTNNSFIPFDIKKEFNLPTYNEKDAIFSYHFYRLIQRAKNIYLLYNTETDDFGSGEQSRFITQLEVLNKTLQNHHINKSIVSPKFNTSLKELEVINKSESIVKNLEQLAKKGISPTSLTNYIYNPIKFYKQKILKIKTIDEVEETIAANTFGTIIHKSLEELYTPFVNKYISIENIANLLKKAPEIIKKHFNITFKNGDITSGKNLLTFEISKYYINTFLKQELALLKSGKQLKIIALEIDLEHKILITNKPIKLIGQADRIDELDGVLRIIDYKTSKVEQSNLTIKGWHLITKDYKKYSKSFQVLMYAYMYAKMNNISFNDKSIESGVISFKNLKLGFLKVNKKAITTEEINNFELELTSLLAKIFNPELPFIENENLPF